eukprot:TRINITY_DN6121_c0_g1_i1.p2 TRINITY_DN6121_c0_g1~~TRINITY_DN6121_c0_g1_i1.p2  ORF type:complete len:241 (-),score=81.08 TRINITY_DN6121_c0_g1_i1:150-872(-)
MSIPEFRAAISQLPQAQLKELLSTAARKRSYALPPSEPRGANYSDAVTQLVAFVLCLGVDALLASLSAATFDALAAAVMPDVQGETQKLSRSQEKQKVALYLKGPQSMHRALQQAGVAVLKALANDLMIQEQAQAQEEKDKTEKAEEAGAAFDEAQLRLLVAEEVVLRGSEALFLVAAVDWLKGACAVLGVKVPGKRQKLVRRLLACVYALDGTKGDASPSAKSARPAEAAADSRRMDVE